MSRIEHIPDIHARAVSLTPYFLRGTKTVAFLKSITDRLQPIEDDYQTLRAELSVQDAHDYLLDIVGSWVLQERDGDDDPTFRARVLAQIVVNASGGQREDVLELIRIVRGEGIRLWHLGGGWLQVNYQITSTPVVNENQLAQIIELIIDPGAVMLNSYTERPFGFAGNPLAFGFGVGQLGAAGDCDCGGIVL